MNEGSIGSGRCAEDSPSDAAFCAPDAALPRDRSGVPAGRSGRAQPHHVGSQLRDEPGDVRLAAWFRSS